MKRPPSYSDACHFARFQSFRTDIDPFRFSVYQDTDFLDVGSPFATVFSLGVAYFVSGVAGFSSNIATTCHLISTSFFSPGGMLCVVSSGVTGCSLGPVHVSN